MGTAGGRNLTHRARGLAQTLSCGSSRFSVFAFARFFLARRIERELDEELQYHVDRQIEEDIASGAAPDEARRAGRRLRPASSSARRNAATRAVVNSCSTISSRISATPAANS